MRHFKKRRSKVREGLKPQEKQLIRELSDTLKEGGLELVIEKFNESDFDIANNIMLKQIGSYFPVIQEFADLMYDWILEEN